MKEKQEEVACGVSVSHQKGLPWGGRMRSFVDSPQALTVGSAAGEHGSPKVSLLGNTVLTAQGVWGTT